MSVNGVKFLVQSVKVRTDIKECLDILNALMLIIRGSFLSKSHNRIAALSQSKLHLQAAYDEIGQFAFIEAAANDSAIHTSYLSLFTDEGVLPPVEDFCSTEYYYIQLSGIISGVTSGLLLLIPMMSALLMIGWWIYQVLVLDQEKIMETRQERVFGQYEKLHQELSKLLHTYQLLSVKQRKPDVNEITDKLGNCELITLIKRMFNQVSQLSRERNCLQNLYRQMQVICHLQSQVSDKEDQLRDDVYFPESRNLGKLQFMHDCADGKFPWAPENLPWEKVEYESSQLNSLSSIPMNSGFANAVERELPNVSSLWLPPPITPLPKPHHSDNDKFPFIRAIGSYTIAARMAEIASIEMGEDRQVLTLWGKAKPLLWGCQVRVEPTHWRNLQISQSSRELLAELRKYYTTDQDVECKFHHIADTVCRGCHARVLCSHSCPNCTLSIDMTRDHLNSDGVPTLSSDMIQEALYYQKVYLSERPCKSYVQYPYSRSIHCQVDKSDARTRWETEVVSLNAVSIYNCKRHCLECGHSHSLPETKLPPWVYKLYDLEHDAFVQKHSSSVAPTGFQDNEPLRQCPTPSSFSIEADVEYSALDDEIVKLNNSIGLPGMSDMTSFGKGGSNMVEPISTVIGALSKLEIDNDEDELNHLLPIPEPMPIIYENQTSLIRRLPRATSKPSLINANNLSVDERRDYETYLYHIIANSLLTDVHDDRSSDSVTFQ